MSLCLSYFGFLDPSSPSLSHLILTSPHSRSLEAPRCPPLQCSVWKKSSRTFTDWFAAPSTTRWESGGYGIVHGAVEGCAVFPACKNWNLGGLLRVHVLLEHDAELLTQGLELGQVLLVLALVLDLGLDACAICCQSNGLWDPGGVGPRIFPAWGLSRTLEDPDGGGVVVDSPGSPESGGENGGGGNEIVGEGVVQVALWLGIESAGPGHEDELGAWVGQAEGIPGARKRPGHRQTPSRSCPRLINQQLDRRR